MTKLFWGIAAFVILTTSLGYLKRDALFWKVSPRYYEPLVGLFSGFRVDYDVKIPMQDGIRLSTDIYLPTSPKKPLGTILIRTPYSKERTFFRDGELSPYSFVKRGYAVAIQDIRGKFDSEGVMRPYKDDGQDGSDTVTWIARQKWSNGRVGTFGCSAGGELQMLLSREKNPHHVAMIATSPGGALGSARGKPIYDGFDGGIFELQGSFGWFINSGGRSGKPKLKRNVEPNAIWGLPIIDLIRRYRNDPTDYEDVLTKPFSDPYWKHLGYIEDDARFSTPALIVDAWLDSRISETLRMTELMRRNWDGKTAPDVHMIIAPGTHCGYLNPNTRDKAGDLPVGPEAMQPYEEWFAEWFDYWVRGNATRRLDLPPYRFFVLGENRWMDSTQWPPSGVKSTLWYLGSSGSANTMNGDGTLQPRTPPSDEHTARFSYDPQNPVPSCARRTPNGKCAGGHVDQRAIESRNDVLVYTSAPLEKPLRIAGPLRADIYVSSSARDTDFTAKLVDVWPDGRALNIQEGALRMRYRDSYMKPELMVPGQVYLGRIDMRATAYYFPAGHRLRLEISSSSFPQWERNLNTGGNNYDESNGIVAVNRVHTGREHPSALIVPEWP